MVTLQIPQAILDAIVSQAQAELPNECCGLLAGTMGEHIATITHRFPLVNELASPTRFRGEARGQFRAMRAMRAANVEWVAVYHSHPTSPAVPSAYDREWNVAPNIACVIVSLATSTADVRVWWIGDTNVPGTLQTVP